MNLGWPILPILPPILILGFSGVKVRDLCLIQLESFTASLVAHVCFLRKTWFLFGGDLVVCPFDTEQSKKLLEITEINKVVVRCSL